MNRERKKLNEHIHGARGLAALMVVFSHVGAGGITKSFFSELSIELQLMKDVMLAGQYGVELFFMISGYLITSSILRHPSVKSFLLDRCIRIYPVFIPAVGFIFVFGPFLNYEYFQGVNILSWSLLLVANLLFLPGIFPMKAALVVAWSLSYEALFYLVMSFYKFFKSNKTLLYGFSILFIVPLLLYFPRAIFFIVGVFIYFQFKGDTLRLRIKSLVHINFFLLLFVLFVLQYCFSYENNVDKLSAILLWMSAVILGYLIFVEIVAESKLLEFVLCSRILQFLGTISYSLYIWHTLIMFPLKRFFAVKPFGLTNMESFVLFGLTSVLASVLVSYISYIILEVRVSFIVRNYISSFNQR